MLQKLWPHKTHFWSILLLFEIFTRAYRTSLLQAFPLKKKSALLRSPEHFVGSEFIPWFLLSFSLSCSYCCFHVVMTCKTFRLLKKLNKTVYGISFPLLMRSGSTSDIRTVFRSKYYGSRSAEAAVWCVLATDGTTTLKRLWLETSVCEMEGNLRYRGDDRWPSLEKPPIVYADEIAIISSVFRANELSQPDPKETENPAKGEYR